MHTIKRVLASNVEVSLRNSKKAIKAGQETTQIITSLLLIDLFREIQKIVCSKLAK
jgi:hypothetical protein